LQGKCFTEHFTKINTQSIFFQKKKNTLCVYYRKVFSEALPLQHSRAILFGPYFKTLETAYFLPAAAFLLTDLIIPTATVCLISLTAKRPRGAYSWKVSTHMGLDGINLTIAP